MVDNYRVEYAYYVDKTGKEFKAPWNQIKNISEVYTAADKAVQTANSDTPYSWIGYDVTNEPLVISLPEIEAKRYYDVQFIDSYTYNFAYLGSRTSGNKAGTYMLAGPNWKGETPQGIDKVIKTDKMCIRDRKEITVHLPKDLLSEHLLIGQLFKALTYQLPIN